MVLAARPRVCWGVVMASMALFFRVMPTVAFASAAQDPPALCARAAQTAANETGVPLNVLLAITLTETGRKTDAGLQPWPWAINQAGTGHWFSTPDEAVQFAEDQLDLGLRNFDVGCFQVNHRWHSKGFTSTIDMLDPTSNALYAARFLAGLYSEHGDWSLAAAAYHSRTPEYADKYRAKFETILAGLTDQIQPVDAEATVAPRPNRFPLLQAGLRGSSASLVPLRSGGVRLIGPQP